ncbi:MAG: hypothetical protein ACQXXJ_03655 [Candidatus Bathyarchaeia archaeon]
MAGKLSAFKPRRGRETTMWGEWHELVVACQTLVPPKHILSMLSESALP